MKSFNVFLTMMILALSACTNSIEAEGNAEIAQDFKVENFDKISAVGNFKMILIPNDSAYVSVQSHQNLIDNMDIYVRNKTLYIKENKEVENFESYVVYLYFNQLKEISISGKILLETSNPLIFDKIEITASDRSMIQQFDVTVKEANFTVLDKSEVDIIGEATKVKLKAKDYANVDLLNLETKIMELDLGGNADVKVNVNNELSGRILQNSSLKHEGNPVKNIEIKENAEISKY